MNVWSRSQPDRRARGGRRAGLRKAFQQQLGGGEPIRSMALVRPVVTASGASEIDGFSGDEEFSSEWSQLDSFPQPGVNNIGLTTGQIFPAAYTHNQAVTVYKLHSIPDQMDTSGTWDLFFNCYVQSLVLGFGLWTHEFWVRLNNSSPDITQDGVRFRVNTGHPNGTGTTIHPWTISEIVAGVETGIASGIFEHALSTNFTVRITRSTTNSTFLINETEVHSGTFTNSDSNQRFAFGLKAAPLTFGTDAAIIDRMAFNFTAATTSEARADRLAAVSNGILHVESATGTLAAVSGTVSLRDDAQLQMQARLNKLYIADYSATTKANASDGETSGTDFDSATYPDWTALTTSIDVDEDVVVITSPVSIQGTYTIASFDATSITLDVSPGDETGIIFTIERGPKVYDSDTGTLELWMATEGSIPTRCPLIALYRSRIILGGARGSEHIAYQSAIGDPFDWDFGKLIPGGAIFNTATPQGDAIATPLTAIVAAADDYLIYGCANELYVQRGDLHFGGYISNLSRKVGIVARNAWCWGPNNEFIFLSRDGIYGLAPGASSFPEKVSRQVMPDELVNIDLQNNVVSMEYDVEFSGVDIYITPLAETNRGRHFFFDWDNKGFWPMDFVSDHQPYSALAHNLVGNPQRLSLMGCRDGYVRTYDDNADSDDGEDITSNVLLGPFMLGDGQTREGVIQWIQAKMGKDSGDVTWEILTGDDAEFAASSAAKASGQFSAGLNLLPAAARRRGFAAYLRLSAEGTGAAWKFEQIVMQLKLAGRLRVA